MTTTQRRFVNIVACPNCDADLVNTGDIRFEHNHLRYYDCPECYTKISVFVPSGPPRLDMMG